MSSKETIEAFVESGDVESVWEIIERLQIEVKEKSLHLNESLRMLKAGYSQVVTEEKPLSEKLLLTEKEGYQLEIQRLKEERVGKWISVEERMPVELDGNKICWATNVWCYEQGDYVSAGWCGDHWRINGSRCSHLNITHWLDIPHFADRKPALVGKEDHEDVVHKKEITNERDQL